MLLLHDLLGNICMRPKGRKSAFLSVPSAIPQRLATASAVGEEHTFPCYANILPLSIVVCNRTITKWLQRLFQRGIIILCVIFSLIYFLIMMQILYYSLPFPSFLPFSPSLLLSSRYSNYKVPHIVETTIRKGIVLNTVPSFWAMQGWWDVITVDKYRTKSNKVYTERPTRQKIPSVHTSHSGVWHISSVNTSRTVGSEVTSFIAKMCRVTLCAFSIGVSKAVWWRIYLERDGKSA